MHLEQIDPLPSTPNLAAGRFVLNDSVILVFMTSLHLKGIFNVSTEESLFVPSQPPIT